MNVCLKGHQEQVQSCRFCVPWCMRCKMHASFEAPLRHICRPRIQTCGPGDTDEASTPHGSFKMPPLAPGTIDCDLAKWQATWDWWSRDAVHMDGWYKLCWRQVDAVLPRRSDGLVSALALHKTRASIAGQPWPGRGNWHARGRPHGARVDAIRLPDAFSGLQPRRCDTRKGAHQIPQNVPWRCTANPSPAEASPV